MTCQRDDFTVVLSMIRIGSAVSKRNAGLPSPGVGHGACGRVRAQSPDALIAAEAYSDYALRIEPNTVPGGPLANWVAQQVWAPSVGLLIAFLPLLFLDGRLLSPRWRPVTWLSALSILLTCGLYGVLLWPLRAVVDRDPVELLPTGQAIVVNAAFPFMALCGLACLTALGLRVRRARGIERQQLKWLLFAAAITVVILSL
jgi:hypothetical protein